jgi:hypothetical protein
MSEIDSTLTKPGDINTKNHFYESAWYDFNTEIVVSNLVFMCKKMCGEWCDFTWEDYKKHCTHKVTFKEKNVINDLVATDYLSEKEGVYSFKKRFVLAVEPFRKK